jgi:hypothetical protein
MLDRTLLRFKPAEWDSATVSQGAHGGTDRFSVRERIFHVPRAVLEIDASLPQELGLAAAVVVSLRRMSRRQPPS